VFFFRRSPKVEWLVASNNPFPTIEGMSSTFWNSIANHRTHLWNQNRILFTFDSSISSTRRMNLRNLFTSRCDNVRPGRLRSPDLSSVLPCRLCYWPTWLAKPHIWHLHIHRDIPRKTFHPTLWETPPRTQCRRSRISQIVNSTKFRFRKSTWALHPMRLFGSCAFSDSNPYGWKRLERLISTESHVPIHSANPQLCFSSSIRSIKNASPTSCSAIMNIRFGECCLCHTCISCDTRRIGADLVADNVRSAFVQIGVSYNINVVPYRLIFNESTLRQS
jgi:hypothetical protein